MNEKRFVSQIIMGVCVPPRISYLGLWGFDGGCIEISLTCGFGYKDSSLMAGFGILRFQLSVFNELGLYKVV